MRKQILLGVLTVFGLTASMQVTAQQSNFKCGVQQQLKQLYADNPQLEEDYRQLVNQYKETKVVGGKTRQVYIIPVVFHVLHEYGSENITDAQIYDQMEILNTDYRKLNADTADIIPQFDTIAEDCMIEFRLATIDPYGQCTNGIEHIYTHLTNQADDFSKQNQWFRNRYLNVWVVNTIGEAGVAGYAYYPTATTGGFFFADGIIILNDYVGSIGSSTPFTSRALTHEIGHYLGLSHTWGSTNDPTIACGDDDVDDTPITKGHDNCSDLYDDECNAGIVENVQNYMEYSYCSNMFTHDQSIFMHNVLDQTTAGRNNLYADSNLTATGALVFPAPICVPVADFSSDKRMACVGDAIAFKDASWRAGVTDYLWTFTGGSPATSTAANPSVTYGAPGWYSVTLKATNAAGFNEKTFTNMIYISSPGPDFVGPTMDDFEGPSAGWWISQNPENNHAAFMLMPNVGTGATPSHAYMLNNYKNVAAADPYTNDFFYYDRLGGSKDYLISPAYDLASTSNVSISFDYAYGTKATTLEDISEEVRVYSSRDCGKTWQLRSNATLSGSEIITAGYVGEEDFIPTSASQWKTNTFTYATTAQDGHIRFRIEYIASDLSSNFFVDNWNITGVLGIEENGQTLGVSLSPNPVSAGSDIAVQIEGTSEDMQLHLVDINGALISTTMVAASNGTQTVMVPMNVAKGCYFIKAVKGSIQSTHRVIVY